MTQPQIEYQVYKEQFEKNKRIVMYDEDGRPAFIKTLDRGRPLTFTEWMAEELEFAVSLEDYEYASQLRDEYKTDKVCK